MDVPRGMVRTTYEKGCKKCGQKPGRRSPIFEQTRLCWRCRNLEQGAAGKHYRPTSCKSFPLDKRRSAYTEDYLSDPKRQNRIEFYEARAEKKLPLFSQVPPDLLYEE